MQYYASAKLAFSHHSDKQKFHLPLRLTGNDMEMALNL